MKISHGFSFIELAIVLALFTLIVSLGVVHGSFMYRVVVKQEIEKLAIICRYLQQAAMVTNKTKTLVFDLKKNRYFYDGGSELLPNLVEFGVLPGIKGPPSSPTRHIDSPVTFKDGRIIFHPDGIIQAGTVYLTSKDKHIMYALSSQVAQFSYMRIYRYDGSWQCVS